MQGIILEKLLRWIFFSVFISFLPIVFGLSSIYLSGKTFDFYQCTKNGEFFLIAVGLSAGVLGELFGSTKEKRHIKIIISGLICLLMLYSSFSFADVLKANLNNARYIPENIFISSSTTLFCTFVCCLFGVILSEV